MKMSKESEKDVLNELKTVFFFENIADFTFFLNDSNYTIPGFFDFCIFIASRCLKIK